MKRDPETMVKLLEKEISKIEKVSKLDEYQNIQIGHGISIRLQRRLERYKELFFGLFESILNDPTLNISVTAFEPVNELWIRIKQICLIQGDLMDIVNSKQITDFTKCFIICAVYQATYEIILDFLEPYAKEINKSKKYFSAKQVKEKDSWILELFKKYQPKTSCELFEHVNRDMRGSISHKEYKILPDGSGVNFKWLNAGKGGRKSLIELAEMNTSLVYHIIMIVNCTKAIQLPFMRNLLEEWKKRANMDPAHK